MQEPDTRDAFLDMMTIVDDGGVGETEGGKEGSNICEAVRRVGKSERNVRKGSLESMAGANLNLKNWSSLTDRLLLSAFVIKPRPV